MAISNIPELNSFFEAWYDHKREPDNETVYVVYQESLVKIKSYIFKKSNRDYTTHEIKKALGPSFGQWMKDNDLPKPRGEV